MAKVRSVRDRKLVSYARGMRRQPTDAEEQLWAALGNRRLGGWKWRRQAPIGPFIVDFLCHGAGLVVELDGDVHATDDAAAYDERRTRYLALEGIRVIRFSNAQVEANGGGVCRAILSACGGPQPGWASGSHGG